MNACLKLVEKKWYHEKNGVLAGEGDVDDIEEGEHVVSDLSDIDADAGGDEGWEYFSAIDRMLLMLCKYCPLWDE